VEWLHDLEADILRDHLASPTPSVISAAASTVDLPRCVQMLDEQTYVCWIDVPVSTIAERSAMGDHRRPMELDELRHRWERRIPIFESVADYRIDGTLPLVEQVETTAVAIEQTGRVP
jgi:shikimate kinase